MIDLDIEEGINLIKGHSVALKECNVFSMFFKINDKIKIGSEKRVYAGALYSKEHGISIDSPE